MKFKKIFSAGILIIWSFLVVIVLSFGTSTASELYQKTFPYIKSFFIKAEVDDVAVEGLPEVLVKEKTYYPTYTALTDSEREIRLKFKNLTPDTLVLNSSGGFRSKPFEGEHAIGQFLITAENDADFKKIVTLDFYSVYPNNFTISAVGVTLTKKGEAYVNLPVFVNVSFTSATNSYSEKDVEYIFDAEYFEKIGENKFLPLKETDKATITAKLKNGEERYYNVKILPEREEVTMIDEVRVLSSPQQAEGRDVFRYNETGIVYLYNGGKRVYTDFKVTLKDESFGKVNNFNYLNFKKAGKVDFTVTLPNGFEFESFAMVENIIQKPHVFEEQFNANGEIETIVGHTKLINFLFSEECTYKIMKFEYEGDNLSVYNTGNNAWSVTPKTAGLHNLKVVVDDGAQSVSVDLVIKAETEGLSLGDWAQYAGKIFGHMGMFLVEGILIIYFLKNYKFKSKWTTVFICASVGIMLGAITELIQYFIPGRSSDTADILIDLTGYVAGIVIAIVLYVNIALKKRAKIKERIKKQARKSATIAKREEKAKRLREAKALEEAAILEEAKRLHEAEALEKAKILEEKRLLEEERLAEEAKILEEEQLAREEEKNKREERLKRIRRVKSVRIKKRETNANNGE